MSHITHIILTASVENFMCTNLMLFLFTRRNPFQGAVENIHRKFQHFKV